MELKASHKKILEYLQKYGAANTFRLSRHLKIDRTEIIKLIDELAGKALGDAHSDEEFASKAF